MVFKKQHAIIILVTLFLIDLIYLFGIINDIYSIVDHGIWLFTIAGVGFAASYLMNMANIEDKTAINILITIGLIINFCLIAFWLFFRNFDPIFL